MDKQNREKIEEFLRENNIDPKELDQKKLILLKNIKLDELFQVYLKVKDIHERRNDMILEDVALDKMATFLPNISFKQFTELKSILKDHDSMRYNYFISKNPDLLYDPSGTSESPIKWWEPMLELEDAQVLLYKDFIDNPNKLNDMLVSKDKKVRENAKNIQNLFTAKFLNIEKSNSPYLMNRKLFLQKHPNYSAQLKYIEAGLKSLDVDCNLVLSSIIKASKSGSDYNVYLFDKILTRLTYLLEDKELKHESNREYLMKIKSFSNN